MTHNHAILLEVMASYTPAEIAAFESFEAFKAQVIVQNAYEPSFSWKKYGPHYRAAWNTVREVAAAQQAAASGAKSKPKTRSKAPKRRFKPAGRKIKG